MLKKIIDNKLLFIAIHIVIGFLSTFPILPKLFVISFLIIAIYIISVSNNKNEEAFLLAMYLCGAEVFIRMSQGFVLYEMGKYGVILFLILGIVLGEFKQRLAIQFLFYLLLLVLGIIYTQLPEGESIRKAIAFNLSGPFVLGISAIYFYRRPINKNKILDALYFMVLPIFSTVSFIYFRAPSIKDIIFNGTANFAASGGFGPNQVATIIGVGIFIVIVFVLLKEKFTGFLLLDMLFLSYFIYRGLLTFSRGGVLTGFISIMAFSFLYLLYKKGSIIMLLNYFLIGGVFIFVIWLYTSDATGGMLKNRYEGRNASGVKKKDISSGRTKIIGQQFNSFLDNPLGIGVGNGKYKREASIEKVTAASHNEVGRLLEEHGAIGFIILLGLILAPLSNILFSNNLQRAFLISFYLFWFLTINHSAMRIAFPGLIYALSLIKIENEEE